MEHTAFSDKSRVVWLSEQSLQTRFHLRRCRWVAKLAHQTGNGCCICCSRRSKRHCHEWLFRFSELAPGRAVSEGPPRPGRGRWCGRTRSSSSSSRGATSYGPRTTASIYSKYRRHHAKSAALPRSSQAINPAKVTYAISAVAAIARSVGGGGVNSMLACVSSITTPRAGIE